jgi:hypothetical protein
VWLSIGCAVLSISTLTAASAAVISAIKH